jgi:GT2 family glycosyltransferase
VAVPLVTVNVLAHDRRAQLATTLRTLRDDLDYPAEALELIVVDNASSDGTPEMLKQEFPEVRVIENENVGAAGWTRGFEAGRGDYFLVLDDDCYLQGDSLRRAVEAARGEGADLVSFRVVSSFEPSFEFETHYEVGLLSFWGCAALISRQAVERLGGYDPNIFIWGNELEFTLRLLDQGFRHLFLEDVEAVHMKPPPTGHADEVHRVHTRHLAYTAAKLLGPLDAVRGLANVALKILLGLPRHPARWRSLPALLAGARAGVRSRAPVRPSVSHLYRANLRDFNSPLAYLVDARHPERGHARFTARRPALYPHGTASLQIPR